MSKATIHYARVVEFWRKEQKYKFLEENQHIGNIEWGAIQPDEKQTWLRQELTRDFAGLIPIGVTEDKQKGKNTHF